MPTGGGVTHSSRLPVSEAVLCEGRLGRASGESASGLPTRRLTSTRRTLGRLLAGPVGEELERLGGWCGWLDRVGDDGQSGVAGQVQRFTGQLKCAGDGVVHLLGGGAVEPDVVAGPPGAELLAAGGKLADEVGEAAVVRVAAGLDAKC